MSDDNGEEDYMSDIVLSVSSDTSGLSEGDNSGYFRGLFPSQYPKNTNVMATLSPNVKKRVEALMELQVERDCFEAMADKEIIALEAQYENIREALYTKRYEIVNGLVEVEGIAQDKTNEGKGVPEFWLKAMQNNELLNKEIHERDEDALKYLKDIKMSFLDDLNGLKLEFFFNQNPYFRNRVLTKTYHMNDFDLPLLEEIVGSEIDWLPGKCFVRKILEPKGSDNFPFQMIQSYKSFFNFFNTIRVLYDDEDLALFERGYEKELKEHDYKIGYIGIVNIIRQAVLWFTGEAVEEASFDDMGECEKYVDEAENVDEKVEDENYKVKARKKNNVMATLSPNAKKRVEVLMEIQVEHDNIKTTFDEKMMALEAESWKICNPLYTKRYEIVDGLVEVEGIVDDSMENMAKDKTNEGKGVPEFWLKTMQNIELLDKEIHVHDEDALKYLKDIRCFRLSDTEGFELVFFFNHNPFFKNLELTKTYHLNDDAKPIPVKTVGSEIEWLPGKCLTEKVRKRKTKKGSNNSKTIKLTKTCKSFFNFFSPPHVPHDDEEDIPEPLEELIQHDYDIGYVIFDKIIPHAVTLFIGEAIKAEGFDISDEENADEELEDES